MMKAFLNRVVTLGLIILQVGDHWLWGRVINGKSFGQHSNVSKLLIKELASNVMNYQYSTIRIF